MQPQVVLLAACQRLLCQLPAREVQEGNKKKQQKNHGDCKDAPAADKGAPGGEAARRWL